MKIQATLVFVLFLVYPLLSQDVKFGEVSRSELEEEHCSLDQEAHAAFLYKHRNTYYRYYGQKGLQLFTEVHERIKIYDQEGMDYATRQIQLYKDGSNREQVSQLKGYTFNLEGGEVVREKLKNDAIFKEDVSKHRNEVKFTMPNVREGSVIEYQYTVSSPFFYSIDDFVFQEDVPVQKAVGVLNVPSWFTFNQLQRGYQLLNYSTEEVLNSNLGINERRTTYEVSDLPALKKEPYVSNMDNYRLSMGFEIVSLQVPGQAYERFAKTWPDVVNTIYQSASFGTELKKNSYYKDDLPSVIEGSTDPLETMYRLFSFVKSKVRWNGNLGYYCENGVRSAYKDGTGNTGDINLMLVSMLKSAGINAQPVLVCTRSHLVPLYPSLNGYNYVVASAQIDGKLFLMDATAPYSIPNILPVKTLNWVGRMINDDGTSRLIPLRPGLKAIEMTMVDAKLGETGQVEGTCNTRYTGHYAYLTRSNYAEGTEESYLERLEERRGGIEISDYEISGTLELTQPLSEKYHFSLENAIERISGKMYVNPLLFLAVTENPFKTEKREYNVELGYAFQDRYVVNIELPTGYRVEFLPEPTAVALPDNQGVFQYSLAQSGKTLTLQYNLELTNDTYAPNFYPFLKEFFNQLVVKNREKIVLVNSGDSDGKMD